MAESSCLSFPPSATVPSIENVGRPDPFHISRMHPLLDSYDPYGIPLKPNSVSFSNLNPCPSNRCQKLTILVHLLVFWVSFLQVVQARKGICLDMQMVASAHAALATAWQTKGFLLWCHSFCVLATSMSKERLIWNLPRFSVEQSWVLEWRCYSPGTLCYIGHYNICMHTQT